MGWRRDALEAITWVGSRFAARAQHRPLSPNSIFVLRNNDLGDVLVATPLFAALRAAFPNARIVAGVGKWAVPLLEQNPNVDAVIPVNAPWHNQQVHPQGFGPALNYILSSPAAAAIRRERFDVGIDVVGSAFGAGLLMRAAIPWRLGVRGYAGGDSACQQWTRFDSRQHVCRAALAFAELLGVTALPEARPQLFLGDSVPVGPEIVFAPGGGFAEKRWPIENFVELARLIEGPICVIGGEQDRALGGAIAASRSGVRDLTGRLSLRESIKVIAEAKLVVCNSSVALHAAAAFRRPSVAVLGRHFLDSEQHQAQWGYPETRMLGRSAAHPEVWTAEEVAPVIREILSVE